MNEKDFLMDSKSICRLYLDVRNSNKILVFPIPKIYNKKTKEKKFSEWKWIMKMKKITKQNVCTNTQNKRKKKKIIRIMYYHWRQSV